MLFIDSSNITILIPHILTIFHIATTTTTTSTTITTTPPFVYVITMADSKNWIAQTRRNFWLPTYYKILKK
jgi:hypothetical protein